MNTAESPCNPLLFLPFQGEDAFFQKFRVSLDIFLTMDFSKPTEAKHGSCRQELGFKLQRIAAASCDSEETPEENSAIKKTGFSRFMVWRFRSKIAWPYCLGLPLVGQVAVAGNQ